MARRYRIARNRTGRRRDNTRNERKRATSVVKVPETVGIAQVVKKEYVSVSKRIHAQAKRTRVSKKLLSLLAQGEGMLNFVRKQGRLPSPEEVSAGFTSTGKVKDPRK